jgi:hypothetical protein
MLDDILTFHDTFSDGSRDLSSPHRPGFRVLDIADANRIAAHDAYESKRARLDYRNRDAAAKAKAAKKPDDDPEDEDDGKPENERQWREQMARRAAGATRGDARQPTLDEARRAAQRAYDERSQRLASAYRRNRT